MSTDTPAAPNAENEKPLSRKHQSRVLAMQALYQWQIAEQDIGVINGQFLTSSDMREADTAYFQEIFQQVALNRAELDDALSSALTRPLSMVNPVEKAILWLGCYELSYRLDVPYRVVLNEAIDLAKAFGGDGAHTLVNATLDKIAKSKRKLEISARQAEQAKKT